MAPFKIKNIDHVVFRVKDLARSVAFYRAVLGSDIVKDRQDLGLVHMRAGTSMVDLISVDGKLGRAGGAAPSDQGHNVDHLSLRIEPFDEAAIVKHLSKFGLSTRGKATMNFGAEGNGMSLYFADPDGNVIELKGPSPMG